MMITFVVKVFLLFVLIIKSSAQFGFDLKTVIFDNKNGIDLTSDLSKFRSFNHDFRLQLYLIKHESKSKKFRFELCYPELSECAEWTQNRNPKTKTFVDNLSLITLPESFTNFNGLATFNDMICDDINHDFYCLQNVEKNGNKKFPGPPGSMVTEVVLSVIRKNIGNSNSHMIVFITFYQIV